MCLGAHVGVLLGRVPGRGCTRWKGVRACLILQKIMQACLDGLCPFASCYIMWGFSYLHSPGFHFLWIVSERIFFWPFCWFGDFTFAYWFAGIFLRILDISTLSISTGRRISAGTYVNHFNQDLLILLSRWNCGVALFHTGPFPPVLPREWLLGAYLVQCFEYAGALWCPVLFFSVQNFVFSNTNDPSLC